MNRGDIPATLHPLPGSSPLTHHPSPLPRPFPPLPQVVAVNRGDIPATLHPLPGSSAWARHITFRPDRLRLHPKDHQTLVLTLDAQILGELDERFSVQVSGAGRPLSLHLRSDGLTSGRSN